MPESVMGVSQRFNTSSWVRCSLIFLSPVSPNCVDHKLRYLREGNLMMTSAQPLVTWVKPRSRDSRLPKEPMLKI